MCRGGVIYFCQGFLSYMMPSMDGLWEESCDEKASQKMTMMFFIICNE